MPRKALSKIWSLKTLFGQPATMHLYALEDDGEGDALQVLRELRHLTQEQVAQKLGLRREQRDQVAKLEVRTNPRLATVQAFVEALGGRLLVVAHFQGWGAIALPFPAPPQDRADTSQAQHEA